jgi:hypothetical protein
MRAALFGFLGGLAAVALKGSVDYWFERQRGQRSMRASLRLVVDEALDVKAGATNMIAERTWTEIAEPRHEAWKENRIALASQLSTDDWLDAVTLHSALNNLHLRSAEAVGAGETTISDDDLTELRANKVSHIERMLAALEVISD